MEEFSKALLEKNYVDAANQLETVGAPFITNIHNVMMTERL